MVNLKNLVQNLSFESLAVLSVGKVTINVGDFSVEVQQNGESLSDFIKEIEDEIAILKAIPPFSPEAAKAGDVFNYGVGVTHRRDLNDE